MVSPSLVHRQQDHSRLFAVVAAVWTPSSQGGAALRKRDRSPCILSNVHSIRLISMCICDLSQCARFHFVCFPTVCSRGLRSFRVFVLVARVLSLSPSPFLTCSPKKQSVCLCRTSWLRSVTKRRALSHLGTSSRFACSAHLEGYPCGGFSASASRGHQSWSRSWMSDAEEEK